MLVTLIVQPIAAVYAQVFALADRCRLVDDDVDVGGVPGT